MVRFMNKGYIYLGTMTLAQKAKSLLSKNKIKCELVKKAGMEGCTWGIEYDKENEKEVKRIVSLYDLSR